MSSRLWSLNAALLHEGILRLLRSFWLHLRNHLTGPLLHARIPSSGNVAPVFAPANTMLLTRVLQTIVASALSSAAPPLRPLAFVPLCRRWPRAFFLFLRWLEAQPARSAQPCHNQSTRNTLPHTTRSPACTQSACTSERV